MILEEHVKEYGEEARKTWRELKINVDYSVEEERDFVKQMEQFAMDLAEEDGNLGDKLHKIRARQIRNTVKDWKSYSNPCGQ